MTTTDLETEHQFIAGLDLNLPSELIQIPLLVRHVQNNPQSPTSNPRIEPTTETVQHLTSGDPELSPRFEMKGTLQQDESHPLQPRTVPSSRSNETNKSSPNHDANSRPNSQQSAMKLNGHLASHEARGKRYSYRNCQRRVSARLGLRCARSRRLEDNTCPSRLSRGLKRSDVTLPITRSIFDGAWSWWFTF
jgi:hypothetical protein